MECAYKTKVVNHIKSLRYVLIGLAFVLLFCYFIAFTEKDTVNPKDLLPGAILWMILGAPAIFLHISYYIKNLDEQTSLEIKTAEIQQSKGWKIKAGIPARETS